MNKQFLVGIDLGTTTLKAVFIDAAACKIVSTQLEEIFPVKAQNPDWIEYDPMDWLEGTARLLKRGFDAGVDPARIAGICFSGWTVTAMFADGDGKPVTNAVHYNDMRHLPELEELEALIGKRCVERNGNYLGVYSGLAKQYWWKKNRLEVFERARRIHTETTWMVRQLTGKDAWNRPEAGFYGQYNTATRDWDDEIIEAMGFPRSLFPKLYDAWEIVGEVTGEAASATGLTAGTPVMAGADDASPSALATGAVAIGQSFLSGGSAANLAANTSKTVSHPTIITYPHCVPGLTSTITVMSSTGLSNKWMRNALCQAEAAVAAITGGDPYDYMNEAAAAAPPGANGVIFLPYLDGDFTPNNDPNARGCFIGLDGGTTKADMLRSVLEGVAFSILDSVRLIREVGTEMDEIIVTGGISKSSVWMQIISDVTGCSISLPEGSEGTPFGDALIAGYGAGLFSSFEEAVLKAVRIKRGVYTPDPERSELYAGLYKIYQAGYPALREMFSQLGAFRKSHYKNKGL